MRSVKSRGLSDDRLTDRADPDAGVCFSHGDFCSSVRSVGLSSWKKKSVTLFIICTQIPVEDRV